MEVDVVSLSSEFPNDNPALHRGTRWVCLDVTRAPTAVPAIVEATAQEVAPVEIAPVPEPRISGVVPAGTVHDELEDDEESPILVEDLPPLDETASLEGSEPALVEGSVVELAVAEEELAVAEEELAVAEEEPAVAEEEPAVARAPLPAPPDDPFVVLVATLTDVAIGAGSPHVASVLPALLLEGRIAHAMPADATQALVEAGIADGTEATAAFVAQTAAWRAILAGTCDDFSACGGAMLDEWAAELLACLLGAPARAVSLRRELRSRGVAAFGLVEAA